MHALHCDDLVCGGLALFVESIWFVLVQNGLVQCIQVVNVDDDGNELGAGIMELTEDELVLRTRKCDAVKWPYLCLRRYGYDSNLFSFESGRRCQTGQGKAKIFHTIHHT